MDFKDRTEAGKQLAGLLLSYKSDNLVILALPRGGVLVGFEIAKKLNSPLDTVVARKISAPTDPEFGVGAIAPGDIIIFNNSSIQFLGLKREDIDIIVEKELKEMDRRMVHYNSGEYSKNVVTDTVIIVDDGLATGMTALAAIESVKIVQKPKTIIFASPVCSKDAAKILRDLVDYVVCLKEVDDLVSVGRWYKEFDQTSDEEVIYLLEEAAKFNLNQ